MARRIIIDCDPGVDDAVALALAFASPELEVLGVTTCFGNRSLATTTRNALQLCELLGQSGLPVHRGCERAIMAPFDRWLKVHGGDGLGDAGLPEPAKAVADSHAVDFIIDQVMARPGEVTLCPIGPMTNLALAIIKEPRLVGALAGIVFMGGAAFRPGNRTPVAEFNFHADPNAAQVMLSAGAPLVMFGLDVTAKATVSDAALGRIAAGGPRGATLACMMRAYGAADPHLHDPCVIAYLLQPELFGGVEAHVSVICDPPELHGQSLAAVSERHLAGRAPNCRVITDVDRDGLEALLVARLGPG
jgi:purine nucleosidase